LPFLFFTLLLDAIFYIPSPLQGYFAGEEQWLDELLILFFSVAFFGICMVFLPSIVQKIWRCKPLSDLSLLERLEKFCQRAKFKHAGMKMWTVMNRAHTAAIVGVVPRFRYVMFTQKLLHYLTPDEVEAVLAHEIGH